jgi:secreted PhoX family phosphatase
MKRRKFIKRSSQVSLGFMGLQAFAHATTLSSGKASLPSKLPGKGYGPLIDDPKGILNLPKNFTYDIISRQGEIMSDGLYVPGLADGMAAFEGPDNKVLIVRNHEVGYGDIANGPFGDKMQLLKNHHIRKFYDFGTGKLPCMGGTTTLLYNPATGQVEKEFLSLIGTLRNCAGGATPWNTWISCEEDMRTNIGGLDKFHGYPFEVPAQVEPEIVEPRPLKAMGRFNHEAVAVDPKTGIIYQTEDRTDGLIYRFIPKENGNLHKGGKLQILAIKGEAGFSTRNWNGDKNTMDIGRKYDVEWLDIKNVNPTRDDLRIRGFKKGAAIFSRGEGMWFGNDEVYFACTNGGKFNYGQIFRYKPSPNEGQFEELLEPGTLELFIESQDIDLMQKCDNLTIGGNGDLVICEDLPTPRIVGISMEGEIYHIAKNVGYKSEFAGGIFSPDGKILFVNIQDVGLTLAIKGPWGEKEIG